MARPATLTWASPALDDLDEIAAWIAQDSPSAAASLVQTIFAAVERLRRFPDSGRWLPDLSSRIYRELIVAPCRIIYRREGRGLLVVHVVRGERRLRTGRLI